MGNGSNAEANDENRAETQPAQAGAAAGPDPEGALTSAPPRLHALGGAPAPPDLADDLKQLDALSEAARAHFWELLEPHLEREIGEGQAQLARRFGEAFGVAAKTLLRLVRACRLLLRSAALADIPVERVTIDLNMLCGDHPEIVKQITAWYREALLRVRSREVLESLPDFGPALEDVRVRKGFVPASRHTPQVVTSVSMMTLCYREGGESKRVTLQLTSQAVELLMARCKELL